MSSEMPTKPLTLTRLQKEQWEWSNRNFPNNKAYHVLLGAMEELGELAHSHLKMEQGIRGTSEEHRIKAADAIGDIIVYLAGYCSHVGFDFQKVVEQTWDEVKERDWVDNPMTGRVDL
jgi:NTP pyrophosphatase (non-canonical NTP hydrolase)